VRFEGSDGFAHEPGATDNTARNKRVHLDEDRLAWLALTLSPGLGPKRILDAMQAVG
jgi:hypothetical protein